jgi:hypothetical protein
MQRETKRNNGPAGYHMAESLVVAETREERETRKLTRLLLLFCGWLLPRFLTLALPTLRATRDAAYPTIILVYKLKTHRPLSC